MVKAKFFVAGVEVTGQYPEGSRQGNVRMQAVSRGAVNASWASATPSGEFKMYISNPGAFEWFLENAGKEVAITVDLASSDPDTHPFVISDVPEGTYGHELCSECGY